MFDGLGSERTVTNSSQTVTGTITFEGFGATIATTGSSSNPYKFAATSGYRDDGDAGLMHVGARYYDAQAGRFITRDTELDQHPFLYCDHDPVNHRDPDGHSFITGPSPQQQEEDRKNRKRRGHTIESGGWGLIGGGTVIVIGGVVASPVVLPMIGIGVAVATGGAIIKWIGGQMQR